MLIWATSPPVHYIFGFSIQEISAIVVAVTTICTMFCHLVHNSITKPLKTLSGQVRKLHVSMMKISERATTGDEHLKEQLENFNDKLDKRLTRLEDMFDSHNCRITKLEKAVHKMTDKFLK